MRTWPWLLGLALVFGPGCTAERYGQDDDSADGDDDGADDDTGGQTDDDTTPDSGILDCAPEDHNAGDCLEAEIADFDMSWCSPVDENLLFTVDTSTEWEELLTESCNAIVEPPAEPDWLEVMLVGAATRGAGCEGHAANAWFRECGSPDERVYAYVQARDGECEEEISLGTGVLVQRSLRVTRFVQCDYAF
jgi:hypothetical protein